MDLGNVSFSILYLTESISLPTKMQANLTIGMESSKIAGDLDKERWGILLENINVQTTGMETAYSDLPLTLVKFHNSFCNLSSRRSHICISGVQL